MILLNPNKVQKKIFAFEKKNLLYNRYYFFHIAYPFILFLHIWHLLQLTIQHYKKPIKYGGYAIIGLLIILLSSQNGVIMPDEAVNLVVCTQFQIQLQKQARNIPNRQKDLTSFFQFKLKFNKKYINLEQEIFRSIVYRINRDKINFNNQRQNKTFNMVINSFADMTALQFSKLYTSTYKSDEYIRNYSKNIVNSQENIRISTELQTEFPRPIKSNDFKHIQSQISFHNKNQQSYIELQNKQFNSIQKTKFYVSGAKTSQIISTKLNSSNLSLQNQQKKNQNFHRTSSQFVQHIGDIYFVEKQVSERKQQQFQSSLQNILQKYSGISQLTFSPLTLAQSSISSSSTSDVNNKESNSSILGKFSNITVDWTIHAGKIRYQGFCGACYTFATSDVVASIYSIYKYGFFVPLSTQQVIDCSSNGLTYGCNGGFLEGSFAYVQIKGIQTDNNYPYVSAASGVAQKCKKDGGSFKITSFKNIQQGNCKGLINQLNYGPVSIGIAGYRLQFYGEGIFNDCNDYIDHAVALISYKGGVGWKIKNSWGANWGMNGFAWIADGNNCGICDMAVAAKL